MLYLAFSGTLFAAADAKGQVAKQAGLPSCNERRHLVIRELLVGLFQQCKDLVEASKHEVSGLVEL